MAAIVLRLKLRNGAPASARLNSLMGFVGSVSISEPAPIFDFTIPDATPDGVEVATEIFDALGFDILSTDPSTTVNQAAQAELLAIDIGVVGAIGGLHCANDGANPDEKVDIDPGFALSSDDTFLIKAASALECDISVSGAANQLDTGSVAANAWYAQWLIGDSTGALATASLLSLSFTKGGLALPTGYDKARFVWPVRTDGDSDILPAFQPKAEGRARKTYWLETHQLQSGGTASTFSDTATSAATRVPPSAVNQQVAIRSTKLGNAAAGSRVEVVPDGWNEAGGGSVWAARSGLNANQDPTSENTVWMPVGPSRLLRYRALASGDASADIFGGGWEDSL